MKKLSQLVLLLRCFAAALWRGPATALPALPARVGVMQLSKIGDMVCTTPVFRALKAAGCSVVVIGNAINKELLAGHPDVDEYSVWRAGDVAALSLDAVVLTSPSAEALAAAYLGGVKAIICPAIEGGTSPHETRVYKLLRRLCVVVPHRMGHYAPLEYLRMLVPLRIVSADTRKSVAIDATAKDRAAALVAPYANTRLVGVAPGAGNKIKEWPPEYFNTVAKAMAHAGDTVVLVGGPGDRELADIVKEGISPERLLDTTGTLSLEELKALIARLNLFVSADTGPVYIAEACDVPTVDIVGPVDEREQPPINPPRHVVVVPARAKPELFVMNARGYNAVEARRQAESISPEEVLRVIERMPR